MPRERKLTLRERACAFVGKEADRTDNWGGEMLRNDAVNMYLAGWHARGRADRVTKAVVDAVINHLEKRERNQAEYEVSLCRLKNAVANLERAKSKGRK